MHDTFELIAATMRAERSLHATFTPRDPESQSIARMIALDALSELSAQLSERVPPEIARGAGVGVDEVDARLDWPARLHELRRSLRVAGPVRDFRRAVLAALSDLAPLFQWARVEEACAL